MHLSYLMTFHLKILKLDFLINSRHKVGERYNDRFAPYSDKIKFCSAKEPESKMVYFHYPILIENRDDIANKLRRNSGIDTRICWPKPIYDQKMYSSGKLESRRHSCPVAEEVSKKILNLPIYPSMLTDQVDEVADALIEELDR